MFDKKLYRSDMISCALCRDAPCDQACPCLKPSDLLRSIWFDNEKTAAAVLPEKNACLDCSAPCERACVRAGQVPIKNLIGRLQEEVRPELETKLPENENLLQTEFCGIPLENPFFLSSSVIMH